MVIYPIVQRKDHMTHLRLQPWVLLLITSHVIHTLITVVFQKKNGKGSTKGFSPSKTATAADSVRHGSERHRCKYRDATWQNRIMRAENVISIRNIVIKKEGNHLQLLQALLFPQKKQEVRLWSVQSDICVQKVRIPGGSSQFNWVLLSILPSLRYLVKSRGHHKTGKSILLKPGSLRRSQYVLLLTQVSLLDFLQTQQFNSQHNIQFIKLLGEHRHCH